MSTIREEEEHEAATKVVQSLELELQLTDLSTRSTDDALPLEEEDRFELGLELGECGEEEYTQRVEEERKEETLREVSAGSPPQPQPPRLPPPPPPPSTISNPAFRKPGSTTKEPHSLEMQSRVMDELEAVMEQHERSLTCGCFRVLWRRVRKRLVPKAYNRV